MGKVSLGIGLGVGYVLGARAGRARYEQIKQAAAGFAQRPEVQQALEQARTAAPAPLRSSIDKLAGGASGGQGDSSGTSTAGTGTAGTGTAGTGTAGTAPPAAPATGGTRGTGAPVPDPLVPPAKSSGRNGRP